MTREPDRFDKQAREVWASCLHEGDSPSHEPIAAALRAAESETLEWVVQELERRSHIHASKIVRALIPPTAAPATGLVVCEHCPDHPHPLNDDGTKCKFPKPAPAAETWKAQGAEARDAEWIEALRLYGVYLDGGRIWQNPPSGHSYDLKLKRLLAAHAAPQSGEGK